jgi:hypothetical protein
MSWTVDSSGTQTATVGTTYTLATSTTNGTFVYEVDISALQNGEVVRLTVGGKTLTGGTANQMWQGTYPAPLSNTRVQSPAIGSDISINVTLTQISGTARAFPWKLLRI